MNVQEVLNISKERKQRTINIIEKIISNIHKKILYYAKLKKESCIYQIPPLIDNTPIYDIVSITKEVFKTLDSEGYIVSAFLDGKLEISWNEKLVEQKVKTDAFVLSHEERKLKNITRKIKNVDSRFNFLANPNKIKQETDLTPDEQLDSQIEKILRNKSTLQKKYKGLLN
jgi:hypothetical protein